MSFSPHNAIKYCLMPSDSLWLSGDYVNEAYNGKIAWKLHDPNMTRNPMFVRLGTCVYTRAWISVPLCLCVEIHIKDIMRDRSCITQLGQSSRGAAGSSSRQMENVLVPLHAWTHSTSSAASTARNLANLRHNFKGTWFREPVNPAGPGRTAQIELFCWKWSAFLSLATTLQLFQLLMR